MLVGITQKDTRLLPVIQKYGCYFLCLAEASPIIFSGESGCQHLNDIWTEATEKGFITGDLNLDKDFDDAGEAEIQDVNKICHEYFNLYLSYDGKHHRAEEEMPSSVRLAIGQYYWKGGHFIILDHKKAVTFDSLGVSNTVKYGKLKTMRWFYAD